MNFKLAKFHPWIGENYHNGFNGVRTLVLGESHYQWPCGRDIETWPEVTNDVIKDQVLGNETKAFWTNIAIAFLNRKPSLTDKQSFWSSVAFYNYVQESAGESARVRPADGSWGKSEGAFNEVLESLKPQFVLVLGYRLWEMTPNFKGTRGPSIVGDDRNLTWIYQLADGSAFAYGIKHPSSGFNGLRWNPLIMTASTIAKSLA